jgi:hypothetical protein
MKTSIYSLPSEKNQLIWLKSEEDIQIFLYLVTFRTLYFRFLKQKLQRFVSFVVVYWLEKCFVCCRKTERESQYL